MIYLWWWSSQLGSLEVPWEGPSLIHLCSLYHPQPHLLTFWSEIFLSYLWKLKDYATLIFPAYVHSHSTSQVALVVKNPTANAGDTKLGVWSLGQKDPLEEVLTIHSSTIAWRIPWTEKPGGLQSIGSQKAGHDWSDLASMHGVRRKNPEWDWNNYCRNQWKCLHFQVVKQNCHRSMFWRWHLRDLLLRLD